MHPPAVRSAYANIAAHFQVSARISRDSLYGQDADHQLPANLQNDARIPFLGFAGPLYESSGLILLAINPGGGGEAYRQRTDQDDELIPLIEAFVAASEGDIEKTFAAMSSAYLRHTQSWNLRRIVVPTVDACGRSLDEICYINCFPFRTAEDRLPSSAALNASWRHIVAPLLSALAPRNIVVLGKKAGKVASSRYVGTATLTVIPRTIGDSRVSPEAQAILNTLRQSAI